jgi:hypothetical protein
MARLAQQDPPRRRTVNDIDFEGTQIFLFL